MNILLCFSSIIHYKHTLPVLSHNSMASLLSEKNVDVVKTLCFAYQFSDQD